MCIEDEGRTRMNTETRWAVCVSFLLHHHVRGGGDVAGEDLIWVLRRLGVTLETIEAELDKLCGKTEEEF